MKAETTAERGVALPYMLAAQTGAGRVEARGVLLAATWQVRVFPWRTDPRDGARMTHDVRAGRAAKAGRRVPRRMHDPGPDACRRRLLHPRTTKQT